MPCSLGVIGLGRMAQALLLPMIEKGELLPEEVLAVVGHQASIKKAKEQFPKGLSIVSADDLKGSEAWLAPTILLAVKPQQLDAVRESLPSIASQSDEKSRLLISLLAGVRLKHLQKSFPGYACIRAVPNTPALVGAGLTGLAWGQGIPIDQKISVKKIFDSVGEVLELPEEQLDAFLALTSSGPAYVALIAEALADGAVAAGLPRLLAYHLAHRTLSGTAQLLQDMELHPGQLKDMVASPGGTTIAALRHLEKAGVRSAVIEAVVVAAERSQAMAAGER